MKTLKIGSVQVTMKMLNVLMKYYLSSKRRKYANMPETKYTFIRLKKCCLQKKTLKDTSYALRFFLRFFVYLISIMRDGLGFASSLLGMLTCRIPLS